MIALSPAEQDTVRATLAAAFGPDVRIWLFGSRARGDERGDVDLFVETSHPSALPARLAARRTLERRLHQKVDLIVRANSEPAAAIDAIARSTGCLL